jgi:hypothetical protein
MTHKNSGGDSGQIRQICKKKKAPNCLTLKLRTGSNVRNQMKTARRLPSPWFATTLTLGLIASLAAQAGVNAPAGFTALYNGKDLAGWRGGDTFDHRKYLAMPEADRSRQDAAWTADMQAHWRAEGDELVNDGQVRYHHEGLRGF